MAHGTRSDDQALAGGSASGPSTPPGAAHPPDKAYGKALLPREVGAQPERLCAISVIKCNIVQTYRVGSHLQSREFIYIQASKPTGQRAPQPPSWSWRGCNRKVSRRERPRRAARFSMRQDVPPPLPDA
jgi:hypothetical protein